MWDLIKNSGADFFVGKGINTIYDVKDVLWRFSQSFCTIFKTVPPITDIHICSDSTYVTICHHISEPVLWGGCSGKTVLHWYKVTYGRWGKASVGWFLMAAAHITWEVCEHTFFNCKHAALFLSADWLKLFLNTCTCHLVWTFLFLLQETC